MPTKTHYDVLEIQDTASAAVIKGAYRFLAQKWHPDKHLENKEHAESVFKQLNEAYAVLSDPARRREYDRQLQRRFEAKASATPKPEPAPKPTAHSASKKPYPDPQPQPTHQKTIAAEPVTNVQIWLRIAARACAFLIDFAVVYYFFSPIALGNDKLYQQTVVLAVMWALVMALVLSVTGTTPGKWLMGIRFRFPQGKFRYRDAAYRNMLIFGFSLGMGFPYTIVLGLAVTLFLMTQDGGRTPYEDEFDLQVTYGKPYGLMFVLCCLPFLYFYFC